MIIILNQDKIGTLIYYFLYNSDIFINQDIILHLTIIPELHDLMVNSVLD